MEHLQVVFGLFVVIALSATLARRVRVPYPILLVAGGVAIALVPFLPNVTMDPDLMLVLFLPPLLYSAAIRMPARELRAVWRPVLLLAVGLVMATMVAVAVVAHAVIPGVTWPVGFVLGAIVSPPDPVAATAIAQRLGLPQRLVTILEAEGLFNDATALVAYRLAVAAVVTGSFSLASAGLRLLLAAAGAVAVGLAVGWVGRLVLGQLSDPPVENTVQLLIPFAAYVAAEHLGASGVLAVLVAGLYLGRYGPSVITSAARVQGRGLWDILVFILEGLSFLLIGLAIHAVLSGLRGAGFSPAELALDGALVCGLVIVVRMAWVFPMASLPALLNRQRPPGERAQVPGWRRAAVVAWAGMRGVVSLAVALALPLHTDAGAPFPERNLLLFLTFCVIVVTLVAQGLTLPALIGWLDVAEPAGREAAEETETRIRVLEAALRRLAELEADTDLPEEPIERLRRRYEARLDLLQARREDREGGDEQRAGMLDALHMIHQELLRAERAELLRARDHEGLSPAVYRRIMQDLDHEEARLHSEP